MTAADLEALALRVEREEPSKWLDEPIARHFANGQEIPPYTSSLDAAASLLPPGWIIAGMQQAPDGSWFCHPWREDETMVEGQAPTEPQARTAAALRAMAQEARDDG